MKRIVGNNSGMALGVVLAIMVVVSILATGMFVFSYNDSTLQSWTLTTPEPIILRGRVWRSPPSRLAMCGAFSRSDQSGHHGAPLSLPEGGENGFLRSTDDEAGSEGSVTVTIQEEPRTIVTTVNGTDTETEYTVWAYDATATVGNSRATASGFSLPLAYVGDPDDTTQMSRSSTGSR
jgi:hypothetical protein